LKRHYEHVTSYFYENKKKFSIFSTTLFKKKMNLKLSIDTKKDLKKIKKIFSNINKKKYSGLSQIEKVYKKLGYA